MDNGPEPLGNQPPAVSEAPAASEGLAAGRSDAVQADAVQPDAVQPDAVQPDVGPVDLVPRLQEAVRRGDSAACREMLTADPDLAAAPSTRGGSLLLEAYERELQDIADLFVAARNDRGITELDIHEASAMGRPGIVQKRLTDDPLVFEEVGPAGFLPLHRAAYRGHLDAVSLLLQMGADPNARSSNGAVLTPVHSAVAGAARFSEDGSYPQVLERLVAAGGDVSLEMEGGWTALSAAERDGLADLFPLLQRAPQEPTNR